jgi:catechol 2,3-dioxygenase-like lactoylglutathione lyase family enzyme
MDLALGITDATARCARMQASGRKPLAQAMVCHDQPSRRRDTMAVTLHHLIIPAKDKRASAQLFTELFGLTVKPSEGRFAQVPLDEHLTIDFADDHTRGILHFVLKQLESHHDAFHVTDEEFDGILGRVKAKGLAYGSGPTTETDGLVADRRGGRAFYFRELNGHLW